MKSVVKLLTLFFFLRTLYKGKGLYCASIFNSALVAIFNVILLSFLGIQFREYHFDYVDYDF